VDGREVSFKESGLKALARLASTLAEDDFTSLERYLTNYGIDLVAFSKQIGEIILIELKGWTNTSSDFNETVHQTLRRIRDFYASCGEHSNVKFACAFPDFLPVKEWQIKYTQLQSIPSNPDSLYYFSSATNVRKADGRNFLGQFVDGSVKAQDLMRTGKLNFLLVKSAESVETLIKTPPFL
jgi:hypothetical protein